MRRPMSPPFEELIGLGTLHLNSFRVAYFFFFPAFFLPLQPPAIRTHPLRDAQSNQRACLTTNVKRERRQEV
jgi:hypothetical protein